MRRERMVEWLEAYDRNGYLNGSLLVASHGRTIVSQGYGLANREHVVPNTPETKFRIGSLTKAFTAMAVLQLHEKHKLSVDDPIVKYVPDYPNGERITIYHCLTNTSGIPNYTGLPDYWSHTMRLPSTPAQLIDSFRTRRTEFEPGSRFGYSNSGYVLLTAIVETVSGMTYADYIQDRICRPCGMTNTGYYDGVKVLPNLATGYSYDKEPIQAAYADASLSLGAFGMYSTTEDLLLWDRALRSCRLLDKRLTDKMVTPHRGSYACGWMVTDVCGRTCLHHFGDVSGFICDFLRFADDEATIVFLSNMAVTPVSHLCREMAKTLFGEKTATPPPAVPVPVANPDLLCGNYRIGNETTPPTISISSKNNTIFLTVPKRYGVIYTFKLVPVSQSSTQLTLITEMIPERLVFRRDSAEAVIRIDYTDSAGDRHVLHKAE